MLVYTSIKTFNHRVFFLVNNLKVKSLSIIGNNIKLHIIKYQQFFIVIVLCYLIVID